MPLTIQSPVDASPFLRHSLLPPGANMVMVAFQHAGCGLQLGPSESFVDWSTEAPATVEPTPAVRPAVSLSEHPDLRAMLHGSLQSLALVAMLLVSLLVGAAGGAVASIGGPTLAGQHARAELVALAQGLHAAPAVEVVEVVQDAPPEVALNRW